jgi:hypothetical protein
MLLVGNDSYDVHIRGQTRKVSGVNGMQDPMPQTIFASRKGAGFSVFNLNLPGGERLCSAHGVSFRS